MTLDADLEFLCSVHTYYVRSTTYTHYTLHAVICIGRPQPAYDLTGTLYIFRILIPYKFLLGVQHRARTVRGRIAGGSRSRAQLIGRHTR